MYIEIEYKATIILKLSNILEGTLFFRKTIFINIVLDTGMILKYKYHTMNTHMQWTILSVLTVIVVDQNIM